MIRVGNTFSRPLPIPGTVPNLASPERCGAVCLFGAVDQETKNKRPEMKRRSLPCPVSRPSCRYPAVFQVDLRFVQLPLGDLQMYHLVDLNLGNVPPKRALCSHQHGLDGCWQIDWAQTCPGKVARVHKDAYLAKLASSNLTDKLN